MKIARKKNFPFVLLNYALFFKKILYIGVYIIKKHYARSLHGIFRFWKHLIATTIKGTVN